MCTLVFIGIWVKLFGQLRIDNESDSRYQHAQEHQLDNMLS